ncbi:protein IRX15-LIKE-like [Impatiens glandulifera]|uniref:protein IRX15-LIKE-like n=1 Tax=Impatiens glandulifera TaxID=253017 RepID=UPI001FB0AA2F|nr:protein IRX15-LIKE-like [Impatiens glandulifera]
MKTSSKPAEVDLLPSSSSSDDNHGGGIREMTQLLILCSIFVFLLLSSLMILRKSSFAPSITIALPSVAKSKPIFPQPASSSDTLFGSSRRKMSSGEIKSISAALSRCNNITHCNFLVFGLTKETLLWHSLNKNGRTVFVESNAYLVRDLESNQPEIEAYDVEFATEVTEMYDLIESVNEQVRNECRPVQNLLYSDCPLGINDLPNYVYDVEWDVILVDGPWGINSGEAAGRMSAIFTAGVLARSKRNGEKSVDVFVNEFDREVEWICSEEFLCTEENLVESKGSLAHFVIGKMNHDSNRFCLNSGS